MPASNSSQRAVRLPDRSKIAAGWPLVVALAFWAIGIWVLPASGWQDVPLIGYSALAVISIAAGAFGLIKLGTVRLALPFAGIAAAAATLLILSPLDHRGASANSLDFLLTAPWRYALPPLTVQFALGVSWPHRRPHWIGWIMGWYAIEAAALAIAVFGTWANDAALLGVIDHLFRTLLVESAAAIVAVGALVLAWISPSRGMANGRPLLWTTAAVIVGACPLWLSDILPPLAGAFGGGGPGRVTLIALPVFGLLAILSLRFRDDEFRDLAGYRLAAPLLTNTDRNAALGQLAESLRQIFGADTVTVRLLVPPTTAIAGDQRTPFADSTAAGSSDGFSRVLMVPIGRPGDPLGEVVVDGGFDGALGPAESTWLSAALHPVADVVRAIRRESAAVELAQAVTRQLAHSIMALGVTAGELPAGAADADVSVPPPVDAREVLSQLGDGVAGVARHGEGLHTVAREARDRSRGTSDAIARGLDALAAFAADLNELAAHGDDIASSNSAVRDVAFRTDLVANNAAIEATRAGAAGRTFGVLAEEVRRLAESTATASAAIEQRTAALGRGIAAFASVIERTREALATAIREAEAAEMTAQRLSETAAELEDAARSLDPAVTEANTVARRRGVRDQLLAAAMERLLADRADTSRALASHRDALAALAAEWSRLADSTHRHSG